jgi:pyruvate formate lyase activating enzyme
VAFGSQRVSFRKTTLVDYPGRIAAALFLPGCGLRCPWCQNRALVLNEPSAEFTKLKEALSAIEKRRSVLSGVVISGGEPTAFSALPPLIAALHEMELPVKLDTNGMNPKMLRLLFSNKETRPDYIALDLKLAPERYAELLPENASANKPPKLSCGERLRESAALITESGIDHEYRSLALPKRFFKVDDVEALAPLVDGGGFPANEKAPPWYFRRFMPGNCLDGDWNNFERPEARAAEKLAERARELGKNGIAR